MWSGPQEGGRRQRVTDVDVYEEKLTVNRTELNDDVVDPNYAFEEGVFEIELRGEEVEVGKRVRRIGQVEFGKERQTRTQRVTGQTRREELEFDEGALTAAPPRSETAKAKTPRRAP